MGGWLGPSFFCDTITTSTCVGVGFVYFPFAQCWFGLFLSLVRYVCGVLFCSRYVWHLSTRRNAACATSAKPKLTEILAYFGTNFLKFGYTLA